ncbi:MAG: chromosomal replication initiator protein DnaA [Planctomycetota bacterium]
MKQVNDIARFWDRVLTTISEELTDGQYATWFARTRCLEATEERLLIGTENEFGATWLGRKYRDLIATVSGRTAGWSFGRIDFVVDDKLSRPEGAREPETAETVAAASAQGTTQEAPAPRPLPAVRPPEPPRAGALSLNPAYTFSNFVVGPSNRLAHAAALAVVEGVGRTYNPLFIHGKLGLGKTHLLQAICHELYRRNPNTKMHFVPCEVFINSFISALGRNRVESFRASYRGLDVLVIDDIHFLANKDHTQEEFFHTFNALYNDQKQIILSSDSPPREIPQLEERLVSRFKWGMVCEIEAPTYETRLSIIRKKAQSEGVDVPDDVAEYLADAIRGSIRELEGAVTSLLGFAALMGQPVSVDTAKASLDGLVDIGARRVSIEQIIELVTDHYGVRLSDLQSKKRFQSITLPRQICMYLIRELTNLSLSEIGGYFGGRDHSTVIYGCDRVRKRLDSDQQFRALVESLIRRLEQR